MASCLYLSKKYISSVTLEITKANKKKNHVYVTAICYKITF